MPIERVLNLPFPSDLTDISSVQEYLQRLYVALTENSYLLVEDIQREANPDASYVVTSSNDNLSDERVLTAGTGIKVTDGGANSIVTVDLNHLGLENLADPDDDRLIVWDDTDGALKWLTVGSGLNYDHSTYTLSTSGLASDTASYITVSSEGGLSNERVLTAGNGISLTDGGANGNMTVAVDSNDVFLLDQTTPQTVINGIPLLDQGHDDFSELKEFVNKDYVDWAATAIGANYYMTDDDDADTGYKVCSLTPSADSETYIEISGITDDQLLGTWISDVGEAPTKLLRGIFDWFIFAEKTSGTKTLRLYWKLYERKADDSEVLVATSSESNELDMGVKTSYIVPLTLDSDYTPDSGSRIVGKIYASVSGSGNAPTVKIYYQGVSGSRWEIPSSTEILDSIYVKQADHTKAAHDALGIDAETTDGYHLDQDVRTTASPTFNDLTLSSPSNIYNLSHDSFADFVANEHIDHTSVTLTAGTGLTGGGDISVSRTFNVDVGTADNKILQVDQVSGLTAGNLVRATSSGLESRTDAEILAQFSGKANLAFGWNGQNLYDINNITLNSFTIGSYYLSFLAGNNKVPDSDKVDGYHLDQDVRTTASPTFQTITATKIDLGTNVGDKIYLYQRDSIWNGFGVDVSGGPYESTWFGSAGPSNEGFLSLGFYSHSTTPTYAEVVKISASENVGIGQGSFGTNAQKVLAIANGTAPTSSPADCFQVYSADQAAGNACPHFRTENGAIIKLYQQAHIADTDGTLADITTKFNTLLSYLENLGLLATS